jgi:hypothetical protein
MKKLLSLVVAVLTTGLSVGLSYAGEQRKPLSPRTTWATATWAATGIRSSSRHTSTSLPPRHALHPRVLGQRGLFAVALGILTGRTPYRNGVFNWIPEGSEVHLRNSEVTMVTLLSRPPATSADGTSTGCSIPVRRLFISGCWS